LFFFRGFWGATVGALEVVGVSFMAFSGEG